MRSRCVCLCGCKSLGGGARPPPPLPSALLTCAGADLPTTPPTHTHTHTRAQVAYGIERVERSLPALLRLAQGGTAVGTGLNTKKGFDVIVAKQVRAPDTDT